MGLQEDNEEIRDHCTLSKKITRPVEGVCQQGSGGMLMI